MPPLEPPSRRDFVRTAGAVALGASLFPDQIWGRSARRAAATPSLGPATAGAACGAATSCSDGRARRAHDTGQQCWIAEFQLPRVHSVWCLVVDGAHATGTGRLLLRRQVIRRLDVRRAAAERDQFSAPSSGSH